MLKLDWIKSTDNKWLRFESVILDDVFTQGVYIIWYIGNPSKVVYVGQGDIAERIRKHRARPDITKYSSKGSLYVTWASVPLAWRDGVECYLANMFDPLVGDAYPESKPVPVNPPW
jgi:hypothetical protein